MTALPRPLVLLFALACGLAVANVYYAQPLLDTLADEFGITRAAAGLVNTVAQVGYGLGLVLLVPLGDTLDRRRLVVGQLVLSALALAAVAAAPGRGALLGAMAAVGALAVVTQTLVAYASSLATADQRGRTVGMVTSGIVVGILLSRAVSGGLADLFGWRAVYVASALATLGVAALLWRALPRQQTPRERLPYATLVVSVFQLLRELPLLRRRALLAMGVFAAITVLLTPMALALTAPPWLLSHTQVGLFGLAGAAGALGAARAGAEADRGRGERATGIGLTLMLAAWGAAALLPGSLWGLVVAVVVMDYGLQSVHVANQSLIYRLRPEAQSRLAAAYMVFYSIGCAAGAMASTWVCAWAGWGGVCTLGAAISAATLACWALTRRRTSEPPENPPLRTRTAAPVRAP